MLTAFQLLLHTCCSHSPGQKQLFHVVPFPERKPCLFLELTTTHPPTHTLFSDSLDITKSNLKCMCDSSFFIKINKYVEILSSKIQVQDMCLKKKRKKIKHSVTSSDNPTARDTIRGLRFQGHPGLQSGERK